MSQRQFLAPHAEVVARRGIWPPANAFPTAFLTASFTLLLQRVLLTLLLLQPAFLSPA